MGGNDVTSVKSTGINPIKTTYANSYSTQAGNFYPDVFQGMGDIGYDNWTSGADRSIFPGMGGGAFGGGYAGGYGPGSETQKMTMEEYLKYQTHLKEIQLEEQLRLSKKAKQLKFSATSQENLIDKNIALLSGAVIRNEQDHIMPLYSRMVTSIRNKIQESGIDASDQQIRAEAERLYAEKTNRSLVDDIREYGDSSLWSGMKKGLTFGLLTDNKSSEENVATITGEPESKTSKVLNGIGQAVGYVGAAVTACLAFKGAKQLVKWILA